MKRIVLVLSVGATMALLVMTGANPVVADDFFFDDRGDSFLGDHRGFFFDHDLDDEDCIGVLSGNDCIGVLGFDDDDDDDLLDDDHNSLVRFR